MELKTKIYAEDGKQGQHAAVTLQTRPEHGPQSPGKHR